jgi:tRNA-(ms[2]io[6]A)-hydroxylase
VAPVKLLACATPEPWLPRVLADLDTLLLDVAHCEKKAAGTFLSFLFRAPECGLADGFSRLAREELVHFEWCLRALGARRRRFERLVPSRYAGELAKAVRPGNSREALLDAMICAALIEARSGERLQLLCGAVDDPELHDLFSRLHPPEERHHEQLWEWAWTFGDPTGRHAELAAREAELVTRGEPLVRMHA